MSRKHKPGDILLVELPYSEVCMHLRVAGQVRAVQVKPNGAQILNHGKPYSAPILQAEAGLPANTLRTADGHLIKDGMRVWTNDLRPGVVKLDQVTRASDGWFHVYEDGHGRAMQNAERVAVRHPATREKA
jgi:hypothetical protein